MPHLASHALPSGSLLAGQGQAIYRPRRVAAIAPLVNPVGAPRARGGFPTLTCLARQVLFERLADGIILPEKPHPIDALASAVDSGQLDVVECTAKTMELQAVLAD